MLFRAPSWGGGGREVETRASSVKHTEKREARRSERLPGDLKEEQKQLPHSKVLPRESQVLMGLNSVSIPSSPFGAEDRL